jgi:hypothetical protein
LLPCSVTAGKRTGFTYSDMDGHCLMASGHWDCEISRHRANSKALLLCYEDTTGWPRSMLAVGIVSAVSCHDMMGRSVNDDACRKTMVGKHERNLTTSGSCNSVCGNGRKNGRNGVRSDQITPIAASQHQSLCIPSGHRSLRSQQLPSRLCQPVFQPVEVRSVHLSSLS